MAKIQQSYKSATIPFCPVTVKTCRRRMEGKKRKGNSKIEITGLDDEQVGYSKLKEAQHRETWSHWRSGPARGQRT